MANATAAANNGTTTTNSGSSGTPPLVIKRVSDPVLSPADWPPPVSVLEHKNLLEAQRSRVTYGSVNTMLRVTLGYELESKELPSRHASKGVGNDVYFLKIKPIAANVTTTVNGSGGSGSGGSSGGGVVDSRYSDVVLRLVNPHPHYRTRKTMNEVLAMSWARDQLDKFQQHTDSKLPPDTGAAGSNSKLKRAVCPIPLPRVLAYSWDTATSPLAGVEFVLMERVGQGSLPLCDLLHRLSLDEFRHCCDQLIDVLCAMRKLVLPPLIGSLTTTATSAATSGSDGKTIAPLTIGPYLMDSAPLGPFKSWSQFIRSCTEYAVYTIAKGRSDLAARYGSTSGVGLIESLAKYDERVIKKVWDPIEAKLNTSSPSPPPPLTNYWLFHGDLNPSNLLFDPQTLELTAVLDWEKVSTAPLSGMDYADTLSWCDEWLDEIQRREKLATTTTTTSGSCSESGGDAKSVPQRFDKTTLLPPSAPPTTTTTTATAPASAEIGWDDHRRNLHSYLFPTSRLSTPLYFNEWHDVQQYNIQLQSIVWQSCTWYERSAASDEERLECVRGESERAFKELRDRLITAECWCGPPPKEDEDGSGDDS